MVEQRADNSPEIDGSEPAGLPEPEDARLAKRAQECEEPVLPGHQDRKEHALERLSRSIGPENHLPRDVIHEGEEERADPGHFGSSTCKISAWRTSI